MAVYNYTIAGPSSLFPNKKVNTTALTQEIMSSGIGSLDYINTDEASDTCAIFFTITLSVGDKTILDSLVSSHTGAEIAEPIRAIGSTITYGEAIDGRIVVEDGTTGDMLRQSLASITELGGINIPIGQTYSINGNPLSKIDIGLDNVANLAQLTRAAGDFNSFIPLLPLDLNDIILVEDTSNAFTKGKASLGQVASLIAPVFGKDYNYTISDTLSTTTATAYSTKLTLTFTVPVNGVYRLQCNYAWYYTQTNSQYYGRMRLDASTLLWTHAERPSANVTTNYAPASGLWIGSLIAGTHSFTLEYAASAAGQTAGIRNARMDCWRVA